MFSTHNEYQSEIFDECIFQSVFVVLICWVARGIGSRPHLLLDEDIIDEVVHGRRADRGGAPGPEHYSGCREDFESV